MSLSKFGKCTSIDKNESLSRLFSPQKSQPTAGEDDFQVEIWEIMFNVTKKNLGGGFKYF